MRILSVLAQKPNSTGSGVYLTELIKAFNNQGYKQAVVAGIYNDDNVILPDGVEFYPVYYKSESLPFAIPGMSDEMPYESTVYCQMTDPMIEAFIKVFNKKLTDVINKFKPDLIICHHLYLLTALVREKFPNQRVVGICHGTDLRQIKKNMLKKQYIIENIQKLDMIFALHNEQKIDIEQTYKADLSKIKVIGSGFNDRIFYNKGLEKDKRSINLIYAGKLNQKKGVMELIKALEYLPYSSSAFELRLAGGSGNEEEYKSLMELIEHSKYNIKLLGKLSQNELADEFNKADIFILPSFYEGLPLVIIEALACGLRVISTDLPGIRLWMDENIPNNNIIYITPPTMQNTDEPNSEDLPEFRKSIAKSIEDAVSMGICEEPVMNEVSWDGIVRNIIRSISNIQS